MMSQKTKLSCDMSATSSSFTLTSTALEVCSSFSVQVTRAAVDTDQQDSAAT